MYAISTRSAEIAYKTIGKYHAAAGESTFCVSLIYSAAAYAPTLTRR
jgi:hypothetical protein